MKYLLASALAVLLGACAPLSVSYPYHYNGQTITLDGTYGYKLEGADAGIALRSGPGIENKPIAEIEEGRFVGVAGPQADAWIPLKILEGKGVVVGYAPLDTIDHLHRTDHVFTPSMISRNAQP